MILEVIIVICGLLVVILGYTTFNLLRKNEKAEKGTFKSDDEIGWFFNEIKVIQNKLSQFKDNL
jgi:cell division protein FtsL